MVGLGAEPGDGGGRQPEQGARPPRLLVTTGGSGGHIYPALAIAAGVRRRWGASEVLFVGARGGIEERLVPEAGFPLETIAVRGIIRKRPQEALVAGLTLGGAVARAIAIVRRFRPDVVVGTGGYAAGPVGLAAVLLRVPLVLQEQNAVPGVTNRLLARFASVVAVPHPEARDRFPRGTRFLVCGNPVRPEVAAADPALARRRLGVPAAGRIVLMFAGSLGSTVFMRYFREMLPHLHEGTLLFVSGRNYLQAAQAAAAGREAGGGGVVVVPYLADIGLGLAAADLVVCRSGAMTLAELATVGRAAILIPSPHVTHHHQEANAQSFARAGAARVLAEADLDGRRLAVEVQALLGDPAARRRMAEAARGLARPDALGRIVAAVEQAARGRRGGLVSPTPHRGSIRRGIDPSVPGGSDAGER